MARPARPGIPGLDVIEHEVPRNPNVVQGVSPQSEAWRGQQAANMGPQQPAGMRAGPPGLAEKISGAAGRIEDLNNRQVASIRAPIDAATAKVQAATNATKAVGNATGQYVSAVATNPLVRLGGGALGLYNLTNDAEAARGAIEQGDWAGAASSGARSAADLASMAAGRLGAAGLAYTGGHVIGTGVDKVLQMSEGGRGLRDKIGSLFASGEDRAKVAAADDFAKGGTGQPSAQKPLTAGLPTTASADPYAAIAASNAAMLRRADSEGSPMEPAGVRAAPPTGNAPGTFRYGNGSTGTGTVSSLDTSEGARQDKMELQRLVAERQVREASMPGNQPGGGLSGFGGGTFGFTPANKAGFDPNNGADRRQAAGHAHERQIASMRETGDMARAGLSADTQRYGTDVNANVSMRGQDMTHQNNLIQRQIAQGQRQYERFKDDRAYQLDLAKHGQAVADSNRAAREAEEKSWQGMAEKRFVVDGKPDTQKIAQFSTAVDSTVPAFIKMLQQTGTPQALAKAKELSSRGKAALGPEDHDLMQKLFELSQVAEQSHGILPGKGSVVRSQNLLDFLPKGNDTGLLGNPITVTANGSRVPTNKLMYGEDDNAFLPTFVPKRSDLVSIR